MDTPLHQLFYEMPWTTWGHSDLEGTIKYLRGCKELNIPQHWRAVLPSVP